MARRRRRKTPGIIETGFALGAGSIALGGLGGPTSVNASAGLVNVSRALPTIGAIKGAGLVLKSVKDLERLL